MLHFPHIRSSQIFRRFSHDSEFDANQQIYRNAKIQDGKSCSFAEAPNSRLLVSKNRHQRCLSSCPNPPTVSEVSGLHFPREPVFLQSTSFRPVFSSLCLHSVDELPDLLPEKKGSESNFLPRRYYHLGRFKEGTKGFSQSNPKYLVKSRFHTESRKIASNSIPRSGMARSSLANKEFYCESDSQLQDKNLQSSLAPSKSQEHHKKISRISPGFDSFCLSSPPKRKGSLPCPPSPVKRYELNFEGQIRSFSHRPEISSSLVVLEKEFVAKRTNQSSRSNNVVVDRRISRWVRGTQRRWKVYSRSLARGTYSITYKCKRIARYLPGPRVRLDSRVKFHCFILRQQNSSFLSKKQGLKQISFITNVRRKIVQGSRRKRPHSSPFSPTRNSECYGRRLVQKYCSAVRMDLRSPDFSGFSSEGGMDATVRRNGDSLERKTSTVHNSFSLPRGSGNRLLCNQDSSVGLSLSFSSSETDFEGFESSTEIPREAPVSSSIRSNPTLVSCTTEQSKQDCGSSTTSFSNRSGEESKSPIVQLLSFSRMDFLQGFYLRKYGSKIATRLGKAFRDSTNSNYDQCWKRFQDFVKDSEASILNQKLLLEFLEYLFSIRKLSPRTILGYRNAVLKPIQTVFGIEVPSEILSLLSRAQFLSLPPNRKILPRWPLTPVLELLSQDIFKSNTSSLENLLTKTIFLIGLATGNRASELVAILRATILWRKQDSEVVLPVKPGFLFKNQRLDKTPPNIMVKRAPLGTISQELCPLTTLRTYIDRSNPSAKGDALFLHPETGRNLQKPTMSLLMTKLIEKACPGSMPKMHDIRKQAVSLAWTRGISPAEIVKSAFWSSSNVFIKHYLNPQVTSTIPCNALNST